MADITDPLSRIKTHLNSIVDLVRSHAITTVIAPTGTGKSLGIPWAVAQTQSRIFISVPTVTAALSLHNFLSKYDTSIKVGYGAEGIVKYDDTSDIVFATAGHIRRKIINTVKDGKCAGITFTTVLMLDEFHTRSADNDIIFNLWLYCQSTGLPSPRLILATATPGSFIENMPKESIYIIPDESYPVAIQYINKQYDTADAQRYMDIINLIISLHNSSTKGHFLIFVPGSADVELIVSHIEKISNILALPAYRELTSDQINLIYNPVIDPIRKVVVATNIVETAITIPDVGVVIDSMLEKRAETSRTGGLRLVTTNISRASAKQRCGRTGRTMAGTCYRMMIERDYDRLEESRPPELTQVPIHNYVMELLNTGLNPKNIMPNVDQFKLSETIVLLRQLNLVDINNKVIEGGNFVAELPLGVRNGVILWDWLNQGYPPFVGIVIVSLIDSWDPPYFYLPRKGKDESQHVFNLRLQEHIDKYFHPYMGKSDIETMINMWHDLMNNIGGYNIKDIDMGDVKFWTAQHSINFKKIRELLNIIRQIINRINTNYKDKYTIQIGPFTTDGAMKVFKPLAIKSYKDREMTLISSMGSRNLYYHRPTNTKYSLDNKAVNMLGINPPHTILAIIPREIKKDQYSINIVNVALDIEDSIIQEDERRNNKPEVTTDQEKLLAAALAIFSKR